VIDCETGKLISAEKYGKVTWTDRFDLETGRPGERPNFRYETGDLVMYPGSSGARNWQAMSYDPATGLVRIPYMPCTRASRFDEVCGDQVFLFNFC